MTTEMKLVPVEPNWEMQVSGRDAIIDASSDDNLDTSTDDAAAIYRAMLTAAPDPWQPIETAPKDGRPIIVTDGAAVYGSAWWHGRDSVWLDCDGCTPTHWMPLPAPPADGGGHEG